MIFPQSYLHDIFLLPLETISHHAEKKKLVLKLKTFYLLLREVSTIIIKPKRGVLLALFFCQTKTNILETFNLILASLDFHTLIPLSANAANM